MSAGARGFVYAMGVVAVLLLALVAYEHWTDPAWRAAHLGVYGYAAVYAFVVVSVTFGVTSEGER